MKKAAELDESDEYGSDGDSEEFFSKRPGAAAVPGGRHSLQAGYARALSHEPQPHSSPTGEPHCGMCGCGPAMNMRVCIVLTWPVCGERCAGG